jgi:hypothetical protein
MSDAVWIEVIRIVPTLVTSILTFIGMVLSIYFSRKALNTSRVNSETLARVEQHTNGLIAAGKAQSRAEGVTEGHAAGVASGAAAEQQRSRDVSDSKSAP